MSKIVLAIFKATPEELEIAGMCVKFLNENAAICHVPAYRIEDYIKSHTVVIASGSLISRQVAEYIEKHKLENTKLFTLPALKSLLKKTGNEQTRKAAFDTLKEVRDYLAAHPFYPDIKTIKNVDLPELTPKQILQLELLTEQNGKLICYQTTKGGKLIALSREPQTETNADIRMTFAEVYTIRSIMDVLNVDEIQVVEKKE